MVDNGTVRGTSKYRSTDLFELFDAVAVRGSEVLFVQFTTNKNHPHKVYIDWSEVHGNAAQLVWYDRRGFVVHWYRNGERTREDLRQ